ncbi:MAG: hypothetical protein GYA23_12865 [Methanomicrobiales archaeon]|nr:hypothetical protein [Methanomicrobiales archaeon]
MKIYPLTAFEVLILLVLVFVVDILNSLQKTLLVPFIQPFVYLFMVIVALLSYFLLLRPEEPMALADSLALTLGVIVLILIIMQDIVIGFDTVSWNTIIILLGAIAGPFIAGFLYGKIR